MDIYLSTFSAFEILSRVDVPPERVTGMLTEELSGIPPSIIDRALIEARYAVVLDEQAKEIELYRCSSSATVELAPDLDYERMAFLSIEVRERLAQLRPRRLVKYIGSLISYSLKGDIANLEGITPDAIARLYQHVRKNK